VYVSSPILFPVFCFRNFEGCVVGGLCKLKFGVDDRSGVGGVSLYEAVIVSG
jgi:hypothetical protein